jgi:hypothetical protein
VIIQGLHIDLTRTCKQLMNQRMRKQQGAYPAVMTQNSAVPAPGCYMRASLCVMQEPNRVLKASLDSMLTTYLGECCNKHWQSDGPAAPWTPLLIPDTAAAARHMYGHHVLLSFVSNCP